MWDPKSKRKLTISGRDIKRADFAFPANFTPEDKKRFIGLLSFPDSIDDKTLMRAFTLIQRLTLSAGDADHFVKLLRKDKELATGEAFRAVVEAFGAAYEKMGHPAAAMYPKFLIVIEREFGHV